MKIFEVSNKPLDTITDISYNGRVVVSSWDGSLYIYNLENGGFLSTYTHCLPITRTLQSSNLLFSDILGDVNFLSADFRNQNTTKTNIKGIHTLEEYNGMYLICGWDTNLCLIQNNNLEYIDTGIKSQASSLFNHELALIEGDSIHVFDMKMKKVVYTKKLNEQLRSVKLDGDIMYIGTYGGRLRIINRNSTEESVINAHQCIQEDMKVGYPVNQIEKHNRIYTCGSDGVLNRFSLGDKITQKVIQRFDHGILRFKKIGSKFVVCCGYNYEKGEGDTSNNPIYIFDA